MRWALLLALLATSALASRADRLSVSPRLDRRDRLGASSAASPILLSLSLLPPDSECSGTPPDGVTFTRVSGATCIDPSGLAHNLTSNQARAISEGLLVEGAATNEALYSRDVAHAVWSDGSIAATCTAGGATGMDLSTPVAVCTSGTVAQFSAAAAGARIFSAYVKTGPLCLGGFATLEADAASTTEAISNSWTRITLPYTSDGDVLLAITADCQFIVDYAQDEAGSIATSPIVTTGTAATRAVDIPTVPTSGLSEGRGCAQLSVTPAWTGPGTGSWVLSNGSSTSRFLYTSTTDHMRSAGGAWAMTVVAGFTSGVKVPWRVEWSSEGATLVNVSTSVSNTDVDASAWGTFGPTLRIGQAAPFYASDLVLGATPEACR